MPYNLQIPGQVSEVQLKAIEQVASLVPANGTVVEVGSLFGRSSWAWAQSVDPSVTVHCIDPWTGNEGVRALERKFGLTYGLDQFKTFTRDCRNIVPNRGFSPRDFAAWDQEIDLYYEDAVHADPVFSQNLAFWGATLKPHGIICGDDYRPRFPDVRAGAERVAGEMNRKLITVDFFWCLLPSDHQLDGAAAVAERLEALSQDWDAHRRSEDAKLSIGPLTLPDCAPRGETICVDVRLTNESIDPWPKVSSDKPITRVGVRVVDQATPQRIAAERSMTLSIDRLEPDIPHHFSMELPIQHLPAGPYRVIFDLLEEGGDWCLHPTPHAALGSPLEISG